MQKSLFGLLSLGLVASATLVLQIETFYEQRRTTSIQKHWVGPNARIAQAYGKLPLSFESNRGQVDSEVKFLAQGSGHGFFLTSNEVVLVLQKPSVNDKETTRSGMGPNRVLHAQGPAKYLASAPSGQRDESSVLRMMLVGAKSDPVAAGLDELPGKSHYFVGNDPAKWRTNVPNYGKVQYEDVYPGIDLVYYGSHRQVEFDFVVAPGSDPSVIQFAFDGREESSIDGAGDLLIESADGSNVRLRKPVVYQESDGARQEIAGNYTLRSDGAVGFRLASYDASRPLIIDPVLSYSTFLGAASYAIGFGIAVDASGNAYVTGNTGGGAFVTKLNAAGSAVGWVSPDLHPGDSTLDVLAEAGMLWDGDFPNDDLPYTVNVMGKPLVIIPYTKESDDRDIYQTGGQLPSVWTNCFTDSLDVSCEEGITHPKMLNASMRAHVLGRSVGTKAIDAAIRYAKSQPKVWFTTRTEIAKWWINNKLS